MKLVFVIAIVAVAMRQPPPTGVGTELDMQLPLRYTSPKFASVEPCDTIS